MKEDTDEKAREDGGRDGTEGTTSPRTPGAPKLEKAGRTLSWSLWRDPTSSYMINKERKFKEILSHGGESSAP